MSSSKAASLFFFFGCLLPCCFCTDFPSNAQLLPQHEVKTLQAISDKFTHVDWQITQRSCINANLGFKNYFINMSLPKPYTQIARNVTCDCNFQNGTVCHVTNIVLKGLNLSGVIPSEFGDLPQLTVLDLTRNYLNGTIPTFFTRIPITNLSLLGNRLSGSIPAELGEIATLQELNLEDNKLGGHLPHSLGNLRNLGRLLLSSNNFTGTIPETFGNLKNLTDFRIDGSNLSGKIPSFIGNWTNMTDLNMQGTGMEGPIPSTISLLTNLEELRISDLSGTTTMAFPNLKDLKNIQRLILRNCLITGPIPDDDFSKMTNLKTLDLSFNKLDGPIPDSFRTLTELNHMFLTNNFLNGTIPGWMLDSKQKFDLSHNNFTDASASSCQLSQVNLVSSLSSSASNPLPCLKKGLPCEGKPKYHSLFINCGGREIVSGRNKYEADLNQDGTSYFHNPNDKWAYSSTGTYMYNDSAKYVATNSPSLYVKGSEYYKTARLSPLSLKYYGLCMMKGNYKVKLHFAEIMFSDDQTFSSLGMRVFDVSIQGVKYLKDFNIAEKAGGIGKGITMEYDVDVNDSTLEIHLYWAGKGTTGIPTRGVYGPLISAITVTPNFTVGFPVGAIVGIVVASCVFLILVLIVLRKKGFLRGKDPKDRDLKGLELKTGIFTFREIKAATNNFNADNKIGEGGFGPVYKGILSDGTIIAIKQLSAKSRQGNREFINEIGIISALQHPCLVKIYGCCVEGDELLLIYEFMDNNSLARALFGPEEFQLKLDWPTRQKICVGIARGLAYLHEESRLKIVHRDIKATNVLLDKDLNPKISDFGLAKLVEEDNTHISTRIAGTYGYMAPEYAMHGYLTDKADVYSFGIVILEIISGRSNTIYRTKDEAFYLLDWARLLKEKGELMELVDPRLGSEFDKAEVMLMIKVALICTHVTPAFRPAMSSVVSILEGKSVLEETVSESSEVLDEKKLETMRMLYRQREEDKIAGIEQQSTSATSTSDLYPLRLDSSSY